MRELRRMLSGVVAMDRARAIGMSERLAAATTLVSSLEHLATREKFRPGGTNDWRIMRGRVIGAGPIRRRLLDLIGDERATVVLHASRVVVSALLMTPGHGRWRGAGNVFLAAGTYAMSPLHRYGSDGSDQASTVTQSAMAVARISSDTRLQDAVLWYGALQLNLSYVIAGWLKVTGKSWREGSALPGIMRTRSYGSRPVFRLMERHPRLVGYVSHCTVAWEALFPIVYTARGALVRPMLGTGLLFHTINGFTMGLGKFLTGFASMYPMAAYTAVPRRHPAAAGRSDDMVRTAAAASAFALVAGLAVAAVRRRQVLDGWPKSETMTTRHGNSLQYKMMGKDSQDAPVIVFVTDIGATPENFAWVISRLLTETNAAVVCYSRAGYGASRRRCERGYRTAESVDDLVDVIGTVTPPGRRAVLVGHAFGAELARRAAGELGDRLQAIVYVDYVASAMQTDDAERDRRECEAFRNISWSLDVGLGSLMGEPPALAGLPPTELRQAMTQFRDSRLWRAARREFLGAGSSVAAEYGELSGVDGLIISSQANLERNSQQAESDPIVAEWHRRCGGMGTIERIESTGLGSLLTDHRSATVVADRIIGFLAAGRSAREPRPDTDPAILQEQS